MTLEFGLFDEARQLAALQIAESHVPPERLPEAADVWLTTVSAIDELAHAEADTKPNAPQPASVEALTVTSRLRENRWQAGIEPPERQGATGEKRSQDMLAYLDLMIATGCRTAELVALYWNDIDLDRTPALCSISATASPVDGTGLVRQTYPRTSHKNRTITLPRFAETTLRDLKSNATSPWVFPSNTGTMRSPNNLNRQWRDARGPEFAWVSGKVSRRTVGELLEKHTSPQEASAHLGLWNAG